MNGFSPFEEELQRALRPVAAPPHLTDEVIRRVVEPMPNKTPLPWPARRWVAGALAASLVIGASATVELQHRRQEQQRESQRQFALAMQVTSNALAEAREQVIEAGIPLRPAR